MMDLILASGSPRRRELLTRAGLALHCAPPDCDETWIEGEPALDYAARVTHQKAQHVFVSHQGRPPLAPLILAADTTVWIPASPAPLGKPKDRAIAQAGLEALFDAGSHRVSTAFCLLDTRSGACVHRQAVSTEVWMRRPSPTELARYLDTNEWNDKAGGYGIQGAAAGFVTRLEGSYTNVVGLPLAEVLKAWAKLGPSRKPR